MHAVSRRIDEALDGCDAGEWALLFSAHNVPLETVLEGDPYVEQLQQTVAQLVPAVMPGDWRFALPEQGPRRRRVAASPRSTTWSASWPRTAGRSSSWCRSASSPTTSRRCTTSTSCCASRSSRSAWSTAAPTPPNDSPLFIEALADVVIDHLARRPIDGARHKPDAPHVARMTRRAARPHAHRRRRRRHGRPGGGARPRRRARRRSIRRLASLRGRAAFRRQGADVRRDGFVVEGGPDSAIIEKPWPIRLARELGIGDRLQDSNEDIRKSFVYARGRLHELPEGIILMVPTRMVPFALSGLISWPGKVRMGMDLVLPRGGAAVSGAGDESLGDFVRRRLGHEALEQHRRAHRRRHPRRRPRAHERARHLPDVPRDGAAAPQPHPGDAAAAQGAAEGGGRSGPPAARPRLDSRARRDSRSARASRRPARAPTSTRSRPGSRT